MVFKNLRHLKQFKMSIDILLKNQKKGARIDGSKPQPKKHKKI
jgi:hypothetical protein